MFNPEDPPRGGTGQAIAEPLHRFHLRMPDYPTALALFIAGDIKVRLMSLPGIIKVVVILNDHIMAAQINRQINETV